MPSSRVGHRRSSALRTQRALILVGVLQGGSYSAVELIELMERLRPGLFPSDRITALQKDIRFARSALGCQIHYSRKADAYTLTDPGGVASLVPLRPNDLSAIAAIRSAFRKPLPHAADVQDFLDRIGPRSEPLKPLSLLLLADGRWEQARPAVEVIERACQEKRQLEFSYHSLQSEQPKRHVVEVHHGIEFRDGHLYLDAYSLVHSEYRTFRVDRIQPGSLQLLSRRIAPRGRRGTLIRYRLTAEAARDGATPHFQHHTERRLPGGEVEVTAEVYSLFFAARVLLHYGESCIVEAPESLANQLQATAAAMLARYRAAAKPHK